MKQTLPFFILFLFTYGLSAQEDADTIAYDLDAVTVSADYLAGDKTPVTFLDIPALRLEAKNVGQEPSFLLSETPSMTVYSDAGSYQGYSYFRMRGIDQTRINMTLDGVPLNEPEDQGVYFSNYPDFLNSVSNIQVQRGVGTSKNGTSSYAGSLQFSSPRLADPQKATFGAGYGSFNSYRAFGEYNTGLKKGAGLYVRASHLHSDGYKHRSANTSSSLFYKGGLVRDKWTLALTGFAGDQRNEMAWLGVSAADIAQDPKTNANAEEDDHFTQALNQAQFVFQPNAQSTIRASVFYNFLNGDYDFDLNNFLGFPSTEEMYNYAFRSHFTGAFANYNLERGGWSWTVGMQGNFYSRRHTGTERAIGFLYENTGFKNEFSTFSKLSYDFGKLLLYADAQYRHTNFDYQGAVPFEKLKWDFVNPKAGLTFSPTDSLSVYYSIGMAGREPTRNDLFGGWDDLPADSLGNAILFITDAERVVDQELGMRFKGKGWTLGVNAYFMGFKNEIVLNGQFGPNGLALNDKVGSSVRTGLELDLTYQPFDFLTLNNASSFNHSQIKQGGESFSPILSPRFILNQEVVYRYKTFETGLAFRYQGASYMDFANENQLDGYALLNWRASYEIKGLRLSFFINNLTNTRYYNNGYVDYDGTNKFFIQAPINFYGMVSYSF